jgi:hypothetical protein
MTQQWFAGVWRKIMAVAGLLGLFGFFLPAQLISLQHLYGDPAYARDDYRSLVATISLQAKPGDAIVLNAPNQWEVFTYYYRGSLPIYTAPYRPELAEATSWVTGVVEAHNQLFVLFWGDTEADPRRYVESELARQAFKANEVWVSSVRMARYGTGEPVASVTLDDIFIGASFNLLAYGLPNVQYAPGDIVPVTLVWFAAQQVHERYKVFVHLVGEGNTLVAQADSEPVGGLWLTSQWVAGEDVTDHYGILLPADIMPGTYDVRVGMYAFSGDRLPVSQHGENLGDYVHLGTVTVEKPQ